MTFPPPVLHGPTPLPRCLRSSTRRDKPGLAMPLVTAKALPEDREQCLASGADDYLAKPATVAELLATIDKGLASPIRR